MSFITFFSLPASSDLITNSNFCRQVQQMWKLQRNPCWELQAEFENQKLTLLAALPASYNPALPLRVSLLLIKSLTLTHVFLFIMIILKYRVVWIVGLLEASIWTKVIFTIIVRFQIILSIFFFLNNRRLALGWLFITRKVVLPKSHTYTKQPACKTHI